MEITFEFPHSHSQPLRSRNRVRTIQSVQKYKISGNYLRNEVSAIPQISLSLNSIERENVGKRTRKENNKRKINSATNKTQEVRASNETTLSSTSNACH